VTRQEIRDAYRAFNRAARLQRDLDAADRLIVKLERDRLTDLATRYQNDRAFVKVVKNFTGHTPYGWMCACGNDGRMKSLVKQLGWDVLKEVIRRVRWRLFAAKQVGGNSGPITVHIDVEVRK
jgi:hypothetical protein